jgi:nicotinamidase-related amidase
MLEVTQVPLSQSALLVVDAQESFKVGDRWARRSNPAFERNVDALIGAHRRAGLPVIYFLHNDADPGFEVGSPHVRLMDFIRPRADEPVFTKNTRNCFTSTALGPYLLERGVRRLAIVGLTMEQCCETTTRVAADLGYAVDFVIDATVTFPIPNWDQPGAELGVREIAERTEYALRRRFARIVTTSRLVGELEACRAAA